MRSCNLLLRTAVRGMYAAAKDMFYRAVNADTVEPVQRLLEKQTAGQAIPCFMVSEASLNCTNDSGIGKKKVLNYFHAVDVITPYLFQIQFNIVRIYPWKSLYFSFTSVFDVTNVYKFLIYFVHSISPVYLTISALYSEGPGFQISVHIPVILMVFHVFTQFFQSNSRPGHYNMPSPFLWMTFLTFSAA